MRVAWICLLGLALIAAMAPGAAATNYNECDPSGVVCIVQDDGSGDDQECDDGYLSKYGVNDAETGAYVDLGNGEGAVVRAHETCGHWFFHDVHSYGFQGQAKVAGQSADVRWEEFDVTPNPDCGWTAEYREGSRLWARANVEGDQYGVGWWDTTTTPCRGGASTYECHTEIWTGAADNDVDLGCPLGEVPSPPGPSEFPYGGLLP